MDDARRVDDRRGMTDAGSPAPRRGRSGIRLTREEYEALIRELESPPPEREPQADVPDEGDMPPAA
jgi:hypothetical protein